MSSANEDLREEVKNEFQLERMTLFSDAVFAIVITLMAIEIRLPAGPDGNHLPFPEAFKHLVPVIAAYAASFFFVGAIWYQHLRLFSVLKDYDRGLVIRNLFLLFLVGLFPFSATVITHSKGSPYAFVTYLSVIFGCVLAQYALQVYILKQRPALRRTMDLTEHLIALKRRKVIVLSMGLSIAFMFATFYFAPGPQATSMAVWWMMLMPAALFIFGRKKKAAMAKVGSASASVPE